jgi:uncharacterized integral membrane protein
MINYQVSFFELFTLPLGVVIFGVGVLVMVAFGIAIHLENKK